MARLTFPSDRLVYSSLTVAGSPFESAAGSSATVYSDSAGTTLADVQNIDGSANAAATFTIDTTSRLPLFLGPASGSDTLYVKVGTGPVTPIYAVTAGDISAAVGVEVTNRQAADALLAKPRGAWAPSTAYAVNDVVISGGAAYRCLTAHTSGGAFSGAGVNWESWGSATSVPPPTLADATKVITVKADGTGYELDPSVSLAQSGQDPSPPGTTARGTGTAAARYDHVHSSGGMFGWLGAGQDGSATFDGTATPTGSTKNSSTHYTLTRDVFYTSATISDGVTVDASGFQMYVNGTLTGLGATGATITAAVTAVSGTNQGTAALGTGNFGGQRPISVGTGTHGMSGGTGAGSSETTYGANSAGRGGAGGLGSGGAGGGGGANHNNYSFANPNVWKRFHVAVGPGLYHILDGFMNNINDVATSVILLGGSGGAAGGGDGTNVGGAGGQGGNIVIVNAKTVVGIVNVTAPGGVGGSPTTGNCGGGGGGGGGVALLNAVDLSGWTGSVSAPGGSGGTKVGTGVNGTAGTAGAAFATAWA